MTEDDARQWIVDRYGVSRETMIARFVEMMVAEATIQNLVSAASLKAIWHRHIVDSAQLLGLAANVPGCWIDIGTGAGFPGMIVALLSDRPVVMIEPRRRRAAFLQDVIDRLEIAGHAEVHAVRAERYQGIGGVISARAVAPLPEILGAGVHLSTKDTVWLLPKGPAAREEVAAARRTWHGSFHVEHSITQPGSLIVTAKGVARR